MMMEVMVAKRIWMARVQLRVRPLSSKRSIFILGAKDIRKS